MKTSFVAEEYDRLMESEDKEDQLYRHTLKDVATTFLLGGLDTVSHRRNILYHSTPFWNRGCSRPTQLWSTSWCWWCSILNAANELVRKSTLRWVRVVYQKKKIERSFPIWRPLSTRLFGESFELTLVFYQTAHSTRFTPILPMGIPHVSTEDDIYKGMFIPKGSLVLANTRYVLFSQLRSCRLKWS